LASDDDDELIIPIASDISKYCEQACESETEAARPEHCKRGCRFFDYAQQSNILNYNESFSLEACTDSCNEAYTDASFKGFCLYGCNQAKNIYDEVSKEVMKILEETSQKMGLFQTLLDLIASESIDFLGDQQEDSLDDENAKEFVIIDHDGMVGNEETVQTFDVEIDMTRFSGSDVTELGSKLCQTKKWLHTLSFILILMGSILLAGLSAFYIATIFKLRKAGRNVDSVSAMETESLPPSYDTLERKGFLLVPNVDIAPVHGEKTDVKILLA